MPCWRWAEQELGWRCRSSACGWRGRAVSRRWCHRGVPACPCPCCSGVQQRVQQRWPGRDSSWVSGARCQPRQMREEGEKECGAVGLQRQLHSPWAAVSRSLPSPRQRGSASPGLERALPRLLLRPWTSRGLAFLTRHLQQMFLELWPSCC